MFTWQKCDWQRGGLNPHSSPQCAIAPETKFGCFITILLIFITILPIFIQICPFSSQQTVHLYPNLSIVITTSCPFLSPHHHCCRHHPRFPPSLIGIATSRIADSQVHSLPYPLKEFGEYQYVSRSRLMHSNIRRLLGKVSNKSI